MIRHHDRVAGVLVTVAMGIVLSACADDSSPSTGSASPANATDRAFAAAMIEHHQSAVEMAEIAHGDAEHEELKQLAGSIESTQKAEISQMEQALRRFEQAGVEEESLGVADDAKDMDTNPAMLRDARPFDREFIDMMIAHHQGAIRMARVELDNGEDAEMRTLAGAIEAAQTREIDQLNMWRVDWYGGGSPAGGVPVEVGTGTQHDG
jgi:uncharacterized protein (DUF305 family)